MTAVARTARPRLAVVADDLTGAADAAAPFASRGAEVRLALSGPPRGDVDVLALVSDSRWREASSTKADWDLYHDVIAKSSSLVSRAAVRGLIDQKLGGDIVHLSSKRTCPPRNSSQAAKTDN